ncbi:MAG TPA: hypothetical protein VEB86_04450 [Chryseosolibacter sp.]|nr:hypothetical protein [Chryseosolibacter sp.]
MKHLLTIAACMTFSCVSAQNIPSAQIQVRAAVLAAPEEQREKATVYGFSDKGEFVLLRKGENEMVCIADDPQQPGFNASCYHKDLEPFMARGRELKKDGKNQQQIFDIREAEVKAGKLVMPKQPATLFVYSTSDEKYNRETGQVIDAYLRYVIYIPYATAESTGLPLKPDAPGMPWIMDPGTHRAHIMINPPVKEQ